MSRRKRGEESKEDFASLLRDAKPLEDRDRQVAPPAPRPRSRRTVSEVAFAFPKPDNPLLGCASDCDRKLLERLRRGKLAFTVTLDLHGLRKAEALAALIRGMREAWEDGEDCVLVIHGRKLGAEPVLKASLPGWLTTPPLASRVLAFAPSQPGAGGPGATVVLLRHEEP